MRFYKFKNDTIINLDNINLIVPNFEEEKAFIRFSNGQYMDMTPYTKEDHQNIMEYNNYLLP